MRCSWVNVDPAMPSQYIPILIYALLAAAFPAVTLLVFKLIRPDMKANGAKLEPYECGVPPEGNARGRYSVRFYMVAILFVIFDVETIFLFPWAIKYGQLGVYGLVTMLVFLGILLIGYVWLYRKGALDWV
ncbi:MAG TPA: NADH-quinone oxidoreductase subunit A [Candidatus Acidoferrales bacterium]|jgi:NADH-quinone oxidoreductase subunit A|nr:NADH-quinone oxidoreductase subunit A [Candidatus Acidoferrales bacterium]